MLPIGLQGCPTCGQTVRRQPQEFDAVGGGTGAVVPENRGGGGGIFSRRGRGEDDSAHVPAI